jgi:molybdenum cofactor cytidylyltransferase
MISAIVLAAGQSKRMWQPKMLLPWGKTTVLGQVIETLKRTTIDQVIVVTGGYRSQVEGLAANYGVQTIHNDGYEDGEMLSSLQCGLREIHESREKESHLSDAVLICLGDQPRMQAEIAQLIVDHYVKNGADIIIPSHKNRRGHPWLVAKTHWEEILHLEVPQTPRDFLNRHSSTISYINVDDSSIVSDVDTYEDYLKSRP